MNQRVLRATPATLVATLTDSDGSPAAPAGTVTVDITTAHGTVVATGRATTQAEDGSGPIVGVYTAAVTAAELPDLDLLTCEWKDGTTVRAATTVDVVGGYYFSVADARAFDPSLALSANYPDGQILAARREVEDECERITRVAWVPRYGSATVNVPYRGARAVCVETFKIRTLRTLAALTAGVSTDLDPATVEVTSWGEILGLGMRFYADRLRLTYEHGADSPPSDLRHACLTRLREILNTENRGINDRATSFSLQNGGVWSLATAGPWNPENRDVNAAYQRHSMRVPGLS